MSLLTGNTETFCNTREILIECFVTLTYQPEDTPVCVTCLLLLLLLSELQIDKRGKTKSKVKNQISRAEYVCPPPWATD